MSHSPKLVLAALLLMLLSLACGVSTPTGVAPSSVPLPVSTATVPSLQTATDAASLPTFTPRLPAPLYLLAPREAPRQIWRLEMNGGFPHPITNLPAGVDAFDISPLDGSLAFVSDNDLYVSGPDGREPQKIVDGLSLQGDDHQALRLLAPLWSPDGRKLVYGLNGVNLLDLQTGETKLLLAASQPSDPMQIGDYRSYLPLSWSPDGAHLLIQIGYYEGGQLASYSLADGKLIELNVAPYGQFVMQDANTFYFAGELSPYNEAGLWRVHWDGNTQNLTAGQAAAGYSFPTFAADGRLMFFATQEEGLPALKIGAPDALGQAQTIFAPDFPLSQVLWTPDGAHFVTVPEEQSWPLYLYGLDGTAQALPIGGRDLRWGPVTDADLQMAQTPAPTLQPTPTLAPPPASSAVITPENVAQLVAMPLVLPHEAIYALAVSPDGTLVALGLEGRVVLWRLPQMQPVAVLKPYGNIVTALDFSPDGQTLLVGSWDRQLDLWDVNAVQKLRSLVGHTDTIEDATFSPDGRWVASGGTDNRLLLWDAQTGALLDERALGSWVTNVDFSPDGQQLAAAVWNQPMLIWQMGQDGRLSSDPLYAIRRPADAWVLDVTYAPDGRALVLADWHYDLLIWALPENGLRNTLAGHADNPRGLAFSPDGQLLVSAAEDGDLRIWQWQTQQQLYSLQGTRLCEFSPDGRLLLTTGPNLQGLAIWYVP